MSLSQSVFSDCPASTPAGMRTIPQMSHINTEDLLSAATAIRHAAEDRVGIAFQHWTQAAETAAPAAKAALDAARADLASAASAERDTLRTDCGIGVSDARERVAAAERALADARAALSANMAAWDAAAAAKDLIRDALKSGDTEVTEGDLKAARNRQSSYGRQDSKLRAAVSAAERGFEAAEAALAEILAAEDEVAVSEAPAAAVDDGPMPLTPVQRAAVEDIVRAGLEWWETRDLEVAGFAADSPLGLLLVSSGITGSGRPLPIYLIIDRDGVPLDGRKVCLPVGMDRIRVALHGPQSPSARKWVTPRDRAARQMRAQQIAARAAAIMATALPRPRVSPFKGFPPARLPNICMPPSGVIYDTRQVDLEEAIAVAAALEQVPAAEPVADAWTAPSGPLVDMVSAMGEVATNLPRGRTLSGIHITGDKAALTAWLRTAHFCGGLTPAYSPESKRRTGDYLVVDADGRVLEGDYTELSVMDAARALVRRALDAESPIGPGGGKDTEAPETLAAPVAAIKGVPVVQSVEEVVVHAGFSRASAKGRLPAAGSSCSKASAPALTALRPSGAASSPHSTATRAGTRTAPGSTPGSPGRRRKFTGRRCCRLSSRLKAQAVERLRPLPICSITAHRQQCRIRRRATTTR